MDANARREIERAADELLDRVADAIAEDARRYVPVDTGHLRGSIERGPVQGNSVRIQATADYAGYVELGTRHQAAQPFLRPATLRKREVL